MYAEDFLTLARRPDTVLMQNSLESHARFDMIDA